jgi:hypothetical protein
MNDLVHYNLQDNIATIRIADNDPGNSNDRAISFMICAGETSGRRANGVSEP